MLGRVDADTHLSSNGKSGTQILGLELGLKGFHSRGEEHCCNLTRDSTMIPGNRNLNLGVRTMAANGEILPDQVQKQEDRVQQPPDNGTTDFSVNTMAAGGEVLQISCEFEGLPETTPKPCVSMCMRLTINVRPKKCCVIYHIVANKS